MGSSGDIVVKFEDDSPARVNQEPLAPGWKSNAEYWVGFFDTPEGTEEWEQLFDNIALEQGFEVVAEFH